MLKLLRDAREQNGVPLTLDQLWREAEKYGRVTVDTVSGNDDYRVRIKMKDTPGGSWIWPGGTDRDIVIALSQALMNADKLTKAIQS